MANNFVFPSWLNANSVRAFPLSESASRRDISGNAQLPDSVLVAAAINTLPEYALGTFFISKFLCYPDFVAIDLSYLPPAGEARVVCRVMAKNTTHVENQAYPILGQGEDVSITGSMNIGDITQAQAEFLGVLDFASDATPFEISTLFVTVPAVKYIEVFNGNVSLGQFTSVLKFRSGQNIRFRYADDDAQVVIVDAIAGLNLNSPDQCEQLPEIGPPIRTINGIPPDASGNFLLESSECIDLEPGESRLTVKDTCASSCCGCDELAALVAAQQAVEAQLAVLTGQISAVQSNQTAMIVNLVANLPT